MNIILLSGGSGKRLWPLSNDVRSKQFLKVLRDTDGKPCSMVQRIFSQICNADLIGPEDHLVIATGESQAIEIRSQLCDAKYDIVTEPERRDTYPAIALACSYLYSKLGCKPNEPVIVMPIDSYVDDGYFAKIQQLGKLAADGSRKLSLLGVFPTHPSEKFGYIVPDPGDSFPRQVHEFKEKPSRQVAQQLIAQDALWNCGVFAFQLSLLKDIVEHDLQRFDFDYLRENYDKFSKTSFDYAVVEQTKSIQAISYSGSWKDLGTWNTLTEEMTEAISGNSITGEGCEDVHIINELGIPLIALGLSNVIIAATRDGILVSDKEKSSRSKSYVESFVQGRPMTMNRTWGSLEVISLETSETGQKTLINKLHIKAGMSISYHSHNQRDESWTLTNGEAIFYIDGKEISSADCPTLPISRGMKHGVKALTDVELVEIQIGGALSGDDIVRFEL